MIKYLKIASKVNTAHYGNILTVYLQYTQVSNGEVRYQFLFLRNFLFKIVEIFNWGRTEEGYNFWSYVNLFFNHDLRKRTDKFKIFKFFLEARTVHRTSLSVNLIINSKYFNYD